MAMSLDPDVFCWQMYLGWQIHVHLYGPAATAPNSETVADASRGALPCVFVGAGRAAGTSESAECVGGPLDGDRQPVPDVLLGEQVVRPLLAFTRRGGHRPSVYRWDGRRYIYSPTPTAELSPT